MARLSVNVNKIATLRNSRGGDTPSVVEVAKDCELFGAEGITVHPRPDERHIRYTDCYELKEVVKTEFNIEGYPNKRFIDLVLDIKPEQVTLVPDPPGVLTSNAGWNTKENASFLNEVNTEFKNNGIRTSIFIDTEMDNIENAPLTGTDRIEFYTGPYAEEYKEGKEQSINDYVLAANKIKELGLGINAGHDLNLENLAYFKAQIPALLEVSIGHALIADALYFGLENTIQMYKKRLM